MRKTYQPLLLPVAIFFCLFSYSCRSSQGTTLQTISGPTMGTHYIVKYYDAKNRNLKSEIDSFLVLYNKSASTYISNSTISQFNQQAQIETKDSYIIELLEMAQKINQETQGAFDPTVMPLVNYWSFGYDKAIDTSKVKIDSLLTLVGFDKISWKKNPSDHYIITKKNPATQLDFSAIAKGHGVDLVAELLEKHEIDNYLVEIGGETRGNGQKPNGLFWKLGIDRPIDTLKNRQKEAIIELKNQALATSGNYRNFYVKDGKKVAHTINPQTGYSELSSLLSASVIAPTCMEADAYATAFMVMGLDRVKTFAKTRPDLGILLIYYDAEEGQLKIWESGETGRLN